MNFDSHWLKLFARQELGVQTRQIRMVILRDDFIANENGCTVTAGKLELPIQGLVRCQAGDHYVGTRASEYAMRRRGITTPGLRQTFPEPILVVGLGQQRRGEPRGVGRSRLSSLAASLQGWLSFREEAPLARSLTAVNDGCGHAHVQRTICPSRRPTQPSQTRRQTQPDLLRSLRPCCLSQPSNQSAPLDARLATSADTSLRESKGLA